VIKALIFDFDGLIMDTESPAVDGWKAIYSEYGQEFPLDVWIQLVVGSSAANYDAADHLAAITGRNLDLPALRTRAHEYRLQKQSTLTALPGVTDTIKTARRLGLRLAIASGSSHQWVEGYLRQLGLLEDFEIIICREDVRYLKPDPEPFLLVLDKLQLGPDETLVFEDSPNGVMAARQAGLRVVVVPNPITELATIQGGSLVLTSLAKTPLKDILKHFDLDIRQETPADIPGIRLVEERAFQRPTEADLVDLCRTRGKVSLSLVAVREADVAGHILFTPVTFEPPNAGLRGLGIGPIAVLPELQLTGIGYRLMHAGLELCREQGCDFIVLLGDPRYYSRFGFTPARTFNLTSD
jgi:HAD superfamily hydrolase (TIGR01509 family)